VVENVDESHLNKAIWLFPLYLLAINIFVLPIAFGGLLQFPAGNVDADTFVLTLPMAEQQEAAGAAGVHRRLSAATGMVIVETIALSTMICNDLVMPVLLRCPRCAWPSARPDRACCWASAAAPSCWCCCSATCTFGFAGEAYALVSIGLISFAAVAQFAPAIFGGHLLETARTRRGALAGLLAGFAVWLYTLLLPALAAPAGCRSRSSSRARSASSCSSRWRCSAWPAWTRSRTR
jgi:Na+/proline symporter